MISATANLNNTTVIANHVITVFSVSTVAFELKDSLRSHNNKLAEPQFDFEFRLQDKAVVERQLARAHLPNSRQLAKLPGCA